MSKSRGNDPFSHDAEKVCAVLRKILLDWLETEVFPRVKANPSFGEASATVRYSEQHVFVDLSAGDKRKILRSGKVAP